MNMTQRMPKGWHSRGYLPHFNAGEIPQMVTFREEGTLPKALVDYWRDRLARNPAAPEREAYLKRIEAHLDHAKDETLLSDPEATALVQDALVHFDGDRYYLLAWVIMPNHVHALLLPKAPHDLSTIVHSWKSWSAHAANRALGRTGAIWAPDYFDRFIRDEKHLINAISYIEMNPVKAGRCAAPELWRWSSAILRQPDDGHGQ